MLRLILLTLTLVTLTSACESTSEISEESTKLLSFKNYYADERSKLVILDLDSFLKWRGSGSTSQDELSQDELSLDALKLVAGLVQDPYTQVHIITERDPSCLSLFAKNSAFKHVYLVAENGRMMRKGGEVNFKYQGMSDASTEALKEEFKVVVANSRAHHKQVREQIVSAVTMNVYKECGKLWFTSDKQLSGASMSRVKLHLVEAGGKHQYQFTQFITKDIIEMQFNPSKQSYVDELSRLASFQLAISISDHTKDFGIHQGVRGVSHVSFLIGVPAGGAIPEHLGLTCFPNYRELMDKWSIKWPPIV